MTKLRQSRDLFGFVFRQQAASTNMLVVNADTLIQHISQPSELEALYRHDPRGFRSALDEALLLSPSSETLQVWRARLDYQSSMSVGSKSLLLYTIFIALIAGTFVKLPAFFTIDEPWFYPRYMPFFVVAALCAYFLRLAPNRTYLVAVSGALLVCAIALFVIPDLKTSASVTMALLHMPIILASVVGVAFAGSDWRTAEARVQFINYAGEAFVLFTLIILGGIVFSGITIGLFTLIDLNIADVYVRYVVVYGVIAAPVVATFVYDQVMARSSRLAILIANVFTPLFLVMLAIYLLSMFVQGMSPRTDREFLVLFNGMLLLVWGMAVFSISGRLAGNKSRIVDAINIALLATTLIIDVIALWAIVLRLYEFGLTPNRIAVTGANVLIFAHLIWILGAYVGQFRGQPEARLRHAIADYLPLYPAWSAMIVVFLPILFEFR